MPRVVLSALQWEIVGRADGTLTPIRLARELGRAGYAVLTEVRRLAAAGLVALPAGAIPLVVRDAPTAHRPVPLIPYTGEVVRPPAGGDGSRVDPPVAEVSVPRRRAPTGSPPGDEPAPPIRAAVPAPAPPGSLPALPRRAPGERLPDLTDELQSAAAPVPADEALLKRIRTALKALR